MKTVEQVQKSIVAERIAEREKRIGQAETDRRVEKEIGKPEETEVGALESQEAQEAQESQKTQEIVEKEAEIAPREVRKREKTVRREGRRRKNQRKKRKKKLAERIKIRKIKRERRKTGDIRKKKEKMRKVEGKALRKIQIALETQVTQESQEKQRPELSRDS